MTTEIVMVECVRYDGVDPAVVATTTRPRGKQNVYARNGDVAGAARKLHNRLKRMPGAHLIQRFIEAVEMGS